jgi:hypothetical protein
MQVKKGRERATLPEGTWTVTVGFQHEYGRAYYDYRAGIEKAMKRNPKSFFKYEDLKKKSVGVSFEYEFWGLICVWCLGYIWSDDVPVISLELTVTEVESVLLDLDDDKDLGPDDLPLSMNFNRSLATSVFPNTWKLS